jgi:adenosyl cobinamide kinase/adenosyl cobinamide phosphate guanylyltransferase
MVSFGRKGKAAPADETRADFLRNSLNLACNDKSSAQHSDFVQEHERQRDRWWRTEKAKNRARLIRKRFFSDASA